MLTLTERAQKELKLVLAELESASTRLRVFIDHRCHCGNAHFSLALEDGPSVDDTVFEVGDIPFVADPEMVPELPSVEIDFVETVWSKGFTLRNLGHECGQHTMH
jgi:iron-sulfur cluster assembly accessory protein